MDKIIAGVLFCGTCNMLRTYTTVEGGKRQFFLHSQRRVDHQLVFLTRELQLFVHPDSLYETNMLDVEI